MEEYGKKSQDVVKAYEKMEVLPLEIDDILWNYETNMSEEAQRHQTTVDNYRQEQARQVTNLHNKKQEDEQEAQRLHRVVMEKLGEARENMSQASQNYEQNYQNVPMRGADSLLKKLIGRIGNTKDRNVERFESKLRELIAQENAIYQENQAKITHDYETRLSNETEKFYHKMDDEDKQFEDTQEQIDQEAVEKLEALQPEDVRRQYETLCTIVPKARNYESVKEMPEAIEIGHIQVSLDKWVSSVDKEELLAKMQDSFSFALSETKKNTLLLPCGRSFSDSNFNKMILFEGESRKDALEYLRALEMRLFMSIPCGKLRVTMFDPVDLGSNFSMFSGLGDNDERVISTKIWSDPKRIKEQLNALIAQIEHVNQDCLRNDYENIVVYNRHVGKNAEPLQALFVADFPRHFDKEACELLEKVVSSGPKCGVYTFIAASSKDVEFNREAFGLDGILRATEQMNLFDGLLHYEIDEVEMEMVPISLPDKLEQTEVLNTISNGIKTSDRITIYFDEISEGLTQNEDRWFNYSEENGLDIPIGLEGASRTVQIHLGGESITQHHALISGTIGAGKSTLLHTIIMSTLLRYSPEEVQVFLLDFKRGVEFKVYADADLSNFRVISLDTEPEFGLAVLRYLDEEQAIRSQEFHDANLQEIEQFNEMAENSHGQVEKFPRILLIIDEFHEMFRDEESEIAKECETLLERIVKQGRAFGIHVILASQVLPENLKNIYSQIMNRIALQSTYASAQCILDSDNEAVNTLVSVDAGKGIFNDGGGNRDSNHLFRVAYFKEDEQKEILSRIKARQDRMFGDFKYEKTRLLLSSIQDNKENPLNQFVETGKITKDYNLGCPLYLGEEISMINTFGIRLLRQRCQNVLIVGSEYGRANLIYSFAAMSILYNSIRLASDNALPEEPLITFFDFSKNRNQMMRRSRTSMDMMDELHSAFPDVIRIFGRDSLQEGLETLSEELAMNNPQRQHYVIFAGLNRAKRMLDAGNAYARPLKQTFVDLVKNGPEVGMNFIVWANEPSSFLSFYGEMLSEFDYRLVYNLKEEEYEQIVNSSVMDTSYGNNVISYNPDDENKKVRLYSVPLVGWFRSFIDRLAASGEEEGYDFNGRTVSGNDAGMAGSTFGNTGMTDSTFGNEFSSEFGEEFGGEFDSEFADE